MGSRFMHLLVADHVARELDIADRGGILLGALAPDARKSRAAHFKAAPHPLFLNNPMDYGRFVLKYRDRFAESFFVGYLSHLVMDDVWTMKTEFSGFERRVQEDPAVYAQYHEDLRLCNAKLDQYYRRAGLFDALVAARHVPEIEEVSAQEVLSYKETAVADFSYPAEHATESLRLFTLQDMVQYVERSQSKAVDICRVALAMSPVEDTVPGRQE